MSDQKETIKKMLESKGVEEQNNNVWYVVKRTFKSGIEEWFRVIAPDIKTALAVAIFCALGQEAQEGGAKYTKEAIAQIDEDFGGKEDFLDDMFESEYSSDEAISGFVAQGIGALAVGIEKGYAEELFDILEIGKEIDKLGLEDVDVKIEEIW